MLTFVYAFQGLYPDLIGPLSNALFPVLAVVAVLSAAFALRKYGPKMNKFLTIWIGFTVGMALWFLGELTWAVYAFFLNVEIPYPSIADLFWLGGYIPLLIGLFVYSRLFVSVLSKRKKMTIAALIVILGILVATVMVVPIVGLEEDAAVFAIDLAYPLLDIALLSMALVGLAIFQKGKLGKSWLWINLGILLNVAGDMIFSFTTAQGTYFNGHLSELLFVYGYLFFTVAFYVHAKEL